eukprot:TRINITY_DN52814_c0_g1_i1.p1 TRINITY_DN52814_c0_g1~~TRINITY_DN52814_c0_g1_i1.p1  ORF type:complete len:269 (-),score=40.49 TRINITY_DN52814_c0_g1_i1:65-871(-)
MASIIVARCGRCAVILTMHISLSYRSVAAGGVLGGEDGHCSSKVTQPKQDKHKALLQTHRNVAPTVSHGGHLESGDHVHWGRSCNWTVFYDQWSPSFDHHEYQHSQDGGVHCLEACCNDPHCSGIQLMSTEISQCYRYERLPKSERRDGRRLGDAKWLLKLKPAWSVVLKGTPEEVHRELATVQEAPFVNNVAGFADFFEKISMSSDLAPWLSRLGVMAVCAAILVRVMAEGTLRIVAAVQQMREPSEASKLMTKFWLRRDCFPSDCQ